MTKVLSQSGRYLQPRGVFASSCASLVLFSLLLARPTAAQDTVCVRVKIEIEQTVTLERQGFRATMKVNNGDEANLTGFQVSVNFADERGNAVAASTNPNASPKDFAFFYRLLPVSALPATIATGQSREFAWQIIPNPESGGEAPAGKLFFVGARVSYTADGVENVIDVQPDSIRVLPMPFLALDYFLPDDVYGDDAMTTQIEPVVPFNLGLRVRNNGYGPARRLQIDSGQPRITENEQGLLIQFQILGSEVNGAPAATSAENASSSLGAFGSAAQNHGANAVDQDWHTVWVPYGDTVYFDGYARVYSIHMGVSWTGGGYHQPEYDRWGWYGNWYNNVGRVQVLGDTTLGYFTIGTPLLIDLSGDGEPDLMAGPQWKFLSERRPSKNLTHFRSLDLDGTGAKRWEWVGPTDGLLVYLPGLAGTPDASSLFGTGTFGKSWKHGYEPLVSLDKDASGALVGDELKDIGIWVDANGDAIAQYGEIRAATDHGVTSLSVGYQKDATGNVANAQGAEMKDKQVAVWDWISYSYPETTDDNEVARFDWTDQQPPVEYFAVNVGEGMEKIKMLPGGTLRVHRMNNQLYVRATAKLDAVGDKVLDVVYPAEVAGDGILQWGTPGIKNALMVSGPDFYGLTLGGEKSYGVWTAKLVEGSLDDLFGTRLRK